MRAALIYNPSGGQVVIRHGLSDVVSLLELDIPYYHSGQQIKKTNPGRSQHTVRRHTPSLSRYKPLQYHRSLLTLLSILYPTQSTMKSGGESQAILKLTRCDLRNRIQ